MKQSRMLNSLSLTICGGVLLMALCSTSQMWAQSACAQLGVDCSHSYSSGGGYHPNYAAMAYYRQMRAQQAIQRRQNKGYAKNVAANAAYDRGDYNQAVRLYRQANRYWPEDQTIYNNLQGALVLQRQQQQNALWAKQARQQAKAQQKKFAEQAKAAQKLAQRQAKERLKEQQRLAKLHPLQANPETPSSTAFFGKSSNPTNPGLQALPSATVGPGTQAMDQLKAMAGTSIAGQKAASAGNTEAASTQAGATPDRGEGNPADAPVITVATPHAEEVLSPKVTQALAADPAYQSLGADRSKASAAADAAQHQLDTLNTQMKGTTDSLSRQQIQIQISNTTQQLQTAQSTVRTDDIQRDDIKKDLVIKYGAPVVIPAGAAAPVAKAP